MVSGRLGRPARGRNFGFPRSGTCWYPGLTIHEEEHVSTYELISILKPSSTDGDLSKFQEAMKTLIESHGGKILKSENMGKRKMAYEVRGEKKGVYFLHHYEGDGDAVAESERMCRLDETILKFMTIKMTKPRLIKGKPRSDREDEG